LENASGKKKIPPCPPLNLSDEEENLLLILVLNINRKEKDIEYLA